MPSGASRPPTTFHFEPSGACQPKVLSPSNSVIQPASISSRVNVPTLVTGGVSSSSRAGARLASSGKSRRTARRRGMIKFLKE